MRKNVLLFGAISGLLMCSAMVYLAAACNANPEFEGNDVLGYAGMIVIFSMIFFGIKNYRDKQKQGIITFGEAFKTGFFIAAVASTMYVLVWLVDYYLFIPGYIDQYTHHVLYEARLKGLNETELTLKAEEMAKFKDMYRNPLFVILVTYMEVLPLGTIISLISALILRKKSGMDDAAIKKAAA